MSALFWNFGSSILYCYCRDNTKYGPHLKLLFVRKQQHGGGRNLTVTLQKVISSKKVIQKSSIEGSCTNNIHTKEHFFEQLLVLKIRGVVSFQTDYKIL